MPKVIILGAGPCGLGAGLRFKELNFEDFEVFEASAYPGGLASSFVDSEGFTWDVGGHVQFSHYEDFDRVMERALPKGWLHHQREAWVWIQDRFVPYPFQNNLWRLPEELRERCLKELEKAQTSTRLAPKNFGEWIDQSFGAGIAEIFLRPYNFKVWAYPPEVLSCQWMGERVATVDLSRVKENIRLQRDDVGWGPNSTFRFPKRGGTGAVWKAVAGLVGQEKIRYRTRVVAIDPIAKTIRLSNGGLVTYETLLSSIPLDHLMSLVGKKLSHPLLSSNSHIVGIGLRGKVPENLKTKCWIYFPENQTPFYRVTVFSNYSPENVPDPENCWSLMCETSSSPQKFLRENELVQATVQGLMNIGFIESEEQIVSRWSMAAKPGYPTPSLDRDAVVNAAFEELKPYDIYSRGRFGAWKYEVSNQDHTFMQGFEWADWYLERRPELTVFDPASANAPGKRPLR